MALNMLPENYKVYIGENGSIVNWPAPGYEGRILPTVNKYTGSDGGYIACYSHNKEGSIYSVGDGIYVMGQIRLQGQYIKRIFQPQGYENQDISAVQALKDLCNQSFPACKGGGWAGGDTGGWFGLQPDPPDDRDKAFYRPISPSLPTSVSLREWCSPIQDQGKLQSCTAHSAIALVECLEIHSSGNKDIQAASALFLYKVTRNILVALEGSRWEGDKGAHSRTTMKALAMIGVPPEKFWPYDETKVNEEPSAFCYALAKKYTATKYYRVDIPGRTKGDVLLQIKECLATNHPLMFQFLLCDSAWEQGKPTGRIPFPNDSDFRHGPHNMAAVGYDDNVKIKNTDPTGIETTGAFLVKNSHSEKWGDKGYGWLPYEYVLQEYKSSDWWTLTAQDWFETGEFE